MTHVTHAGDSRHILAAKGCEDLLVLLPCILWDPSILIYGVGLGRRECRSSPGNHDCAALPVVPVVNCSGSLLINIFTPAMPSSAAEVYP